MPNITGPTGSTPPSDPQRSKRGETQAPTAGVFPGQKGQRDIKEKDASGKKDATPAKAEPQAQGSKITEAEVQDLTQSEKIATANTRELKLEQLSYADDAYQAAAEIATEAQLCAQSNGGLTSDNWVKMVKEDPELEEAVQVIRDTRDSVRLQRTEQQIRVLSTSPDLKAARALISQRRKEVSKENNAKKLSPQARKARWDTEISKEPDIAKALATIDEIKSTIKCLEAEVYLAKRFKLHELQGRAQGLSSDQIKDSWMTDVCKTDKAVLAALNQIDVHQATKLYKTLLAEKVAANERAFGGQSFSEYCLSWFSKESWKQDLDGWVSLTQDLYSNPRETVADMMAVATALSIDDDRTEEDLALRETAAKLQGEALQIQGIIDEVTVNPDIPEAQKAVIIELAQGQKVETTTTAEHYTQVAEDSGIFAEQRQIIDSTFDTSAQVISGGKALGARAATAGAQLGSAAVKAGAQKAQAGFSMAAAKARDTKARIDDASEQAAKSNQWRKFGQQFIESLGSKYYYVNKYISMGIAGVSIIGRKVTNKTGNEGELEMKSAVQYTKLGTISGAVVPVVTGVAIAIGVGILTGGIGLPIAIIVIGLLFGATFGPAIGGYMGFRSFRLEQEIEKISTR